MSINYVKFPNLDTTQGDIKDNGLNGVDVNTCLSKCDSIPTCNCVVYDRDNSACYPKQININTLITRTLNNTTDLYMKSPIQSNQSNRTQIDNKVAEIYGAQGTNASSLEENYRTTMLVGVVWAMLGTTVLYYTFKNL